MDNLIILQSKSQNAISLDLEKQVGLRCAK